MFRDLFRTVERVFYLSVLEMHIDVRSMISEQSLPGGFYVQLPSAMKLIVLSLQQRVIKKLQ